MRTNSNKTLKVIGVFGGMAVIFNIFLFIAIILCWGTNLYKLTQCDFEAPYKGEIIHAVGIIPPASLVTVWFDDK